MERRDQQPTVSSAPGAGPVRKRPTINDVAALAGVSKSTVSRVLLGERISDETMAQRVTAAAAFLEYRRDHRASSLRRSDGSSASIGLIFDDVSNPFFSAVHRGVEEVARERGVLAFVGSSDRLAEREKALANNLNSRGVDGLIVAPVAPDQRHLLRDQAAGVPVIFIDRLPHGIEADYVVIDNAGGVRMAIDQLVHLGHRRIAFLGGREVFSSRQRLNAYQATLRGYGIPIDDELIDIGLERTLTQGAVRRMLNLSSPPTAFFSAQLLTTLGTLDVLHEADLRDTVAQIGFDDVPLAELLKPGLSVVAPNPTWMGMQAAQLLFARIDGHTGAPRALVAEVELRRRGSGEVPPQP